MAFSSVGGRPAIRNRGYLVGLAGFRRTTATEYHCVHVILYAAKGTHSLIPAIPALTHGLACRDPTD